ncbi:proteasome subunit beta type-1 [Galendromus occidentalis]|uniref:Proteasome subunit beta n=1 Tax=Galendromus occidentalis TaxID=34638 RepID=A0AAJ6VY01_9ACAR|nr:proteasome subunit beta type-1 [Galendromus occidentalis]
MMSHEPEPSPTTCGAPLLQRGFDPYRDNAGTLVGIAGEDFAVIGSDLRLSLGFSIFSRDQSKLFKLTDRAVLGSSGCWADCVSLNKFLEIRLKTYGFEHNQPMSTKAIAQCCSTMLYSRRFFPYFAWNILAGIDEDGKGAIYSYDPVGNFERVPYQAAGNSGPQVLPFLDSIVGKKNQSNPDKAPITKERAINLIKDIFISAAERDITVGDGTHIIVITKDGLEEIRLDLRKD